jgi:hypothetical protein
MKDSSVAKFGNVQADPDSEARGNEFHQFVSACVQRNGA